MDRSGVTQIRPLIYAGEQKIANVAAAMELPIVENPCPMVVAMIMAFIINARLASVYLIAVVLLSGVLALLISRAMKYFRQVFKKYDDLNASVQEDVSAIRVVKAYVREKYENKKFRKASANLYKMFVSAEKIVSWNGPIMNATVYTCILVISWLGAHMIVSGSLTTGELMSLLTYCMNILMSLLMLSMIFVMVTMSAASAERVSEVLNEKADITNPEEPDYYVPDGSVEFRHADFAYNRDSENPVLKDINISIRSGETIGIIGGTGSAKTSLVNLIDRMLQTELLLGIILLLIGIWMVSKPSSVIALLQYVVGALIVIHGIIDLQAAINIKRAGFEKWGMLYNSSFFWGFSSFNSISRIFKICVAHATVL